MSDAHTEVARANWDGDNISPFAIGHKKLGMWLFIASDAMTFTALLIGYSYVRASTPDWPAPFHFFPSIVGSTLMTLILLSSSLTMVLAVHAAGRREHGKVAKWIAATIVGGVLFLVLHLREWMVLMEEGMMPWENPWGSPLFGATFFGITGLHMFHVLTGVCYLGVIAVRATGSRNTYEDVEIAGLYWHFVDLVWMFVFPMIYLLSVAVEAH